MDGMYVQGGSKAPAYAIGVNVQRLQQVSQYNYERTHPQDEHPLAMR